MSNRPQPTASDSNHQNDVPIDPSASSFSSQPSSLFGHQPFVPTNVMSTVAGPSVPASSFSTHLGNSSATLSNSLPSMSQWPSNSQGASGTSMDAPSTNALQMSAYLGASNPMTMPVSAQNPYGGQSSFLSHRRVNTESSAYTTASNAGAMGFPQRDDGVQLSASQGVPSNAVPTSKPVVLGPVRIHQFFPTSGEAGVPVTVLATINAEWARSVGLHLQNGIFGGHDSVAARAHGGSRFVMCFGASEVETRCERSISLSDSPFAMLTSLEGTSYMSGGAKDLDLTIIASAPAYPGPHLQFPSQGGRVPIRIKLVGAPLDPSLDSLKAGLSVGEYCYWQVSPRSNLKRHGEELLADPHNLRRPASFPAMGAMASATGENDGRQPSNTHPSVPRSQTLGRLTDIQTTSPRRPALVDTRAPTAHDFRSADAMPSITASSLQQNGYGDGHGGYGAYPGYVAPPISTSSGSSLRRNSFGFSSNGGAGGMGSGSEISRPSTELPPYHMVKAEGQPYNAAGVHSDNSTPTPQLIRSTQLVPSPPTNTSSIYGPQSSGHSYNHSISSVNSSPPTDRSGLPIPASQRASLEIHGSVQDMAIGWSHTEWQSRRRLVQFWRKQEGTTIHAICKAITPDQYVPNSVVVSCIFWDVTNECYITSVDIIYLLEALVASRFNVEEKNRIRRNLEGLKPKTISKIAKSGDAKLNKIHEDFFKLVMSFPNPKPRHIEKDIKIFPWRVVPSALNKIISKYSAAPLLLSQQQQVQQPNALNIHTPFMMAGAEGMPVSSGAVGNVDFTSPSIGQPSASPSQQQRRFQPSGMSIDVDAAQSTGYGASGVAGYGSGASAPASGAVRPSMNGQSLLFPPPSTPFRGGLGIGGAGMMGYPSPRNPSMSMPGSTTFNFSDFVVSPVSFGQTPLQQAQTLGASGSQMASSHHDTHGGPASGLGMDLGNVYKPE